MYWDLQNVVKPNRAWGPNYNTLELLLLSKKVKKNYFKYFNEIIIIILINKYKNNNNVSNNLTSGQGTQIEFSVVICAVEFAG